MNESDSRREVLVDSGYFTVVADVGVVGLAVLLAFIGRLGYLALRWGQRGDRTGWFALGALVVLTLDALTRESFTGFPTPWVAFLLLGLAASGWAARGEALRSLSRGGSRAVAPA